MQGEPVNLTLKPPGGWVSVWAAGGTTDACRLYPTPLVPCSPFQGRKVGFREVMSLHIARRTFKQEQDPDLPDVSSCCFP